jgi:hypothetical protein
MIKAIQPNFSFDAKTDLLIFQALSIARTKKKMLMVPQLSLESHWGSELNGMQINAIQGGYMKTEPSW